MKTSIRSSSAAAGARGFARRRSAIAVAAAIMAQAGLAAAANAQTLSSDASAAQYLRLGASATMALQTTSEGSALERIMREQGQASGAAPTPAPAPASDTAGAGLIKASYVYTPPARATAPAPLLPEAPAVSPPAAAGHVHHGVEPDVFGSTAISVGGSALGWRWRQASAAAAPTSARWTREVQAVAKLPVRERLASVNSWVNHALDFASDEQLYGERDHWASARESLARGRGDCEDFALAKLQLLRASGVPANDLYLVIVRDVVRRSDHAVLAVRVQGEFLVLDNGADQILDADAVQDYRPVITFSGSRTWVHGFKQEPTLMLASNTSVAPAGSGAR